jgi:hypothetical protein
MGNVSTNKKLTTDVVVDKSIQDHGNDPAVQERARKAVAFLKKHGVPKSFEKKNRSFSIIFQLESRNVSSGFYA